ncbi:MAG: rhamnulokinase [Clostridia bacterium]|nr:rhamnulokinase [Clostridia bacterium]
MNKKVLAIDFGASSGRAIIGTFDGEKISLEEVHRFSNDPVTVNGTVYWDVLRLFHEIKQSLTKAGAAGGFDSIGIDTWGVDFGLLDKEGRLLENPVHYRDKRTSGLVDKAFETIPKEHFYELTGIQFMELNTMFQLYSLALQRPELLERADKLLFMPDLLAYMLTGKPATEYSIATTSQLVDINTKTWCGEIFDKLGIPLRLMGEISLPGETVRDLSPDIVSECGLDGAKKVISVCGHDTQSAITAVPSDKKDFIFLSSGTWSLFGTELDEPVVNATSLEMNVTNEGGCEGKTGFLKNITGLWLIQESRRHWLRHGREYSYADLEKLALEAEPFAHFIDPDYGEFGRMGNIPQRIRDYCKAKTGREPSDTGAVVRCIYESLAMKYRMTFEKIKACTGRDYSEIHVIGGGVKDGLLCQMTANACGVPVLAGPTEATVLGNIAVQLISQGCIKDVTEARKVIAHSEAIKVYTPENTEAWSEAYGRFLKINE